VKLNTDVKVIFNPKSKVRDINSHREHSVAFSPTLVYRHFCALQQEQIMQELTKYRVMPSVLQRVKDNVIVHILVQSKAIQRFYCTLNSLITNLK
jgi:hypothetical protein